MHHIRYFLALSETPNLTKAAERCNVSQPALSRAITLRDLELSLDMPVLRQIGASTIMDRYRKADEQQRQQAFIQHLRAS